MEQYKLNLVTGQCHLKSAAKLQGKFRNIKANSLAKEVDDILQLHELRSFELFECRMNLSTLANALRHMTMLKELTIKGVKILDESLADSIEPIQMRQLRSLKLKQCKMLILTLISTTSLENVEIQSTELSSYRDDLIDFASSNDSHLVNQFLLPQPSLKHLSLCGDVVLQLLLNEDFLERPFNLESLELLKCSIKDLDVELMNLLHTQNQTLKKLRIESPLMCKVQIFILQKLPELQEVEISLEHEKNEERLYIMLKDMPKLKSLSDLSKSAKSITVYPKLSVVFMNLESFSWSDPLNKTSLPLSVLFPELKTLRLDSINVKPCTDFDGIRDLCVAKIDGHFFHEFIEKNAETLERLEIGWIDDDSFSRNDTLNYIKRCTKLKHISFTSGSPFVVRLFKKITRDFAWTLESKFKAGDEVVKVVFRFPDDRAVFEEKCTTWDDQLIREFSTFDNYGLNAFVNQFK